ncbi:M6 family metalloprotease domain-containing protein [Hydrogenivirga sp.]
MRFFKSTLTSLALLSFTFLSFAVPADPYDKHVFIQPDGTEIVLKKWGDEFLSGLETEEGYTVVVDKNGYYVYALLDNSGNLVPSDNVVGIDSPPDVPIHLRPKNEDILMGIKSMKSQVYAQVVPPSGVGKIPVILINFSNTQTIYNRSDFESLIFGSGTDSVKDYYEEVSYGTFTIEGEVVGWYTASRDHDYYGANDGSTKDVNVRELIREAVQEADDDINYALYDTDGDCYVDVVAVIHQGTGEEAINSSDTDIWSHRSVIADYTTQDNCSSGGKVKVRDYIIMPELLGNSITTIGILAHEYGHALGLPDLYDTDYSSNGIGMWGLMGFGSWNGSPGGSSPAHLSAWSKAKLGWVTPQIIFTSRTDFVIEPVENNKNHVLQFIVGKPGEYGEYFLVENRQKIGFDSGLPAEGLLIWHIDESVTNNRNECGSNHSSCGPNHYKVALEQADDSFDLENGSNRGDDGDVYPCGGSACFPMRTSFTVSESDFYNGDSSHMALTNIRVSGNNIIVNISPGVYPDISVSATELDFGVVGADDEYLSFSVTNVGDYKMRINKLYISGSSIFEIHYGSTCRAVQFLNPGDSCIVEVKAQNLHNLGAQRATLTIETDDPDEPSVTVALKSSALPVESGAGCNTGSSYAFILLIMSGLFSLKALIRHLTQS